MKRILIILLVGIFLISMVSAESSYICKQNRDCSIELPVYDENFNPLTSCVANLSVSNTEGAILTNSAATCGNGKANYTLASSNTSTLTTYDGRLDFCSGTKCGFTTFSYQVTPSGSSNILGFFIVLIIVIYAIAFIGFFGKNPWVAMLGGMAMLGLGLFTINNGVDVFRNQITDIFSWTTIGLGAFFALYSGIAVIQENYNN